VAACTQEDIAAAVSVSRVTVSRVLGGFAQRGWVELGYRTIRLKEPKALLDLS
jgi:CRP/FNR family transcriptional regulator